MLVGKSGLVCCGGWRRFGPWRTMLMMLRRLKLLLDHKIRLHQRCQLPLTIAGVLLSPENIHTYTDSHKHTYTVTQTQTHIRSHTNTHAQSHTNSHTYTFSTPSLCYDDIDSVF